MIKLGAKKLRPLELLGESVIRAVAFTSLLAIALIFIFVFREAGSLFSGRDKAPSATDAAPVEYETYGDEEGANAENDAYVEREVRETPFTFSALLSELWQPVSLEPKYGLWPLIAGSFKAALVAVLIAGPLSILAALFTAVFSPPWLREIVKPVIELLAGFPSVVIGFFALAIMASFFQNLFGTTFRLNAFVGGVAMSLAIIPIIYTIADDSLVAVPKTYVEASLALGATKWETALFVILPAALPGIFAAVLLGIGRAVGETMIVLMATGNSALLSPDIFESVRTLSATIGAEMAEVVFGETHYGVLFLIGVILFVFSFTLCFVAEVVIRDRLMHRFQGA